ncbi:MULTISPECIES: GNAT family N-acetyltransferase [unclassified Microbacterium]|uniref:GNAT family N-acetyltransferase n=1 Tax=unclassified Microbacterium TaxID=2609290 RepID=UPI00214C25A7|nr:MULTISPECIES: GNAT family N-acetyltransferase [unclassified Microbacterium]MCR2799612.1 GNAT family N-acetyltransferase [Microbacterium sp. zg.Y818]MCR2827785.1 GNAT family N-acetyltransferase [Microbacterium sp. zg.Y909]WIM23930.1 GNAT family N-acetyltransferase [Microbacterium sp. zg-Y818]
MDVVVRDGTPDDAPSLAVLKLAWANRHHATVEESQSFARDLASWMASQGDSLLTRVAEHRGDLVGMAWLVVFDRVPDFSDRNRRTGDVQSVFVNPEFRRRGIGHALVSSLVDAADRRGIPRITVSSNDAATRLYLGTGFEASPRLLERRLNQER